MRWHLTITKGRRNEKMKDLYMSIMSVEQAKKDIKRAASGNGLRSGTLLNWTHIQRLHDEELNMDEMFKSMTNNRSKLDEWVELWMEGHVRNINGESKRVIVAFGGYKALCYQLDEIKKDIDPSKSAMWDEMIMMFSVDGGPVIVRGEKKWKSKLKAEIEKAEV